MMMTQILLIYYFNLVKADQIRPCRYCALAIATTSPSMMVALILLPTPVLMGLVTVSWARWWQCHSLGGGSDMAQVVAVMSSE